MAIPTVPSCLTVDGKWIALEDEDSKDLRFVQQKSAKFSDRFPGVPADGLLLQQAMEKKYAVLARTDFTQTSLSFPLNLPGSFTKRPAGLWPGSGG